jgi:hypothetical protein
MMTTKMERNAVLAAVVAVAVPALLVSMKPEAIGGKVNNVWPGCGGVDGTWGKKKVAIGSRR